MDFKKLSINVALTGLFIFSLLAFIITTQVNNSVNIPLTDNQIINSTYFNFNQTLSNSQTTAGGVSQVSFENGTSSGTDTGEINVRTILGTTKVFKTLTTGLYYIFIQLPIKVLGVSPIVTSIFGAIFVLLIIIGIWAILKGAISVT